MRRLLLFLFLICFLSCVSLQGCKQKTPGERYTVLIQHAEKYRENNKINEAKKELIEATQLDPHNYLAFFYLGELLLNSGSAANFSLAYDYFLNSLNLNPDHRESRLRVASFLVLSDNPEQAETHIRKLLEKNSEDIDARILDITLDSRRKSFSSAKTKSDRLLSENPDNAIILAAYAGLLLQEARELEKPLPNIQKAEELFLKALKSNPQDETVRISLADLYANTGQVEKAGMFLQEAVQNNPHDVLLRFNYGEFLLEQGKFDAALKEYEQTLTESPAFFPARDRLFDYYVTRGDIVKAKSLVDELRKKTPDSPTLIYFQGRLLALDKKMQEALQAYMKVIESLPDFAPGYRGAGLTELALGQRGIGLEHLRQTIAIDPLDISANLVLAQEAIADRDYDTALGYVNRILSKYPKHIGANTIRADIALLKDDLKTAEFIYNVLLENFPGDAGTYFKLAMLREKQEQFAQAMEYYKKYTELSGDVLGLNRYIELYVIRHKSIDAGIKEVLRLKGKMKNISAENINFLLGVLYRDRYLASKDTQDLSKATGYFKDVLSSDPKSADAYIGLAQIAQIEKKTNEVIEHYKRVVEFRPDDINSRIQIMAAQQQLGQNDDAKETARGILQLVDENSPLYDEISKMIEG